MGPGLETIWRELDTLQQAAIAEAVHITGGGDNPDQFYAKYGDYPNSIALSARWVNSL
ncbi:MAG: hypothetical protein AB4042_11170 [Leptolyngbyaceae cyanobacterium]